MGQTVRRGLPVTMRLCLLSLWYIASLHTTVISMILPLDTLDPAPAPGTPSCPSGWVNAHTEGCFAFLTETKVTWEDAMVVCEKMGGYLAQPQTLAQMEFLTGLAGVYTTLTGVHNWWLGLSDIGHEGIWEWVHTMEVCIRCNLIHIVKMILVKLGQIVLGYLRQ